VGSLLQPSRKGLESGMLVSMRNGVDVENEVMVDEIGMGNALIWKTWSIWKTRFTGEG
jgi:hypothetical protein